MKFILLFSTNSLSETGKTIRVPTGKEGETMDKQYQQQPNRNSQNQQNDRNNQQKNNQNNRSNDNNRNQQNNRNDYDR